jgi:hypothetical protein
MSPLEWILAGLLAASSTFGWFEHSKKNEALMKTEVAQVQEVKTREELTKKTEGYETALKDTRRALREKDKKLGTIISIVNTQAQDLMVSNPDEKHVIHADTTVALAKEVPPEKVFTAQEAFNTDIIKAQQVALDEAQTTLEVQKQLENELRRQLTEARQQWVKATQERDINLRNAIETEKQKTSLMAYIESFTKWAIGLAVVGGIIFLIVTIWLKVNALRMGQQATKYKDYLKNYDKAVATFGIKSDEGNTEMAEILASHGIPLPTILQRAYAQKNGYHPDDKVFKRDGSSDS